MEAKVADPLPPPKAPRRLGISAIATVNAKYGIQKINVAPALDALSTSDTITTRLRPAEVEAAFAGAGISLLPEY